MKPWTHHDASARANTIATLGAAASAALTTRHRYAEKGLPRADTLAEQASALQAAASILEAEVGVDVLVRDLRNALCSVTHPPAPTGRCGLCEVIARAERFLDAIGLPNT
jgi:hypothetical protein